MVDLQAADPAHPVVSRQAYPTGPGSNPHSPGEWRVNGPLSMMPEFQAAWGCKEGDPMVRKAEGRAKIW